MRRRAAVIGGRVAEEEDDEAARLLEIAVPGQVAITSACYTTPTRRVCRRSCGSACGLRCARHVDEDGGKLWQ